MEPNMKDIGKMICSMEKVLKLGLMAAATKVITKKVKNMGRAHTYGAMVPNM